MKPCVRKIFIFAKEEKRDIEVEMRDNYAQKEDRFIVIQSLTKGMMFVSS